MLLKTPFWAQCAHINTTISYHIRRINSTHIFYKMIFFYRQCLEVSFLIAEDDLERTRIGRPQMESRSATPNGLALGDPERTRAWRPRTDSFAFSLTRKLMCCRHRAEYRNRIPERTRAWRPRTESRLATPNGIVYIFADAKINVLPPSSWRQATVHRTVAFEIFESVPRFIIKIRPPKRVVLFLWRPRTDSNRRPPA